MKFYYKGQLVRTSKTHTYNWAILEEKDDGTLKVYGCRAERAAADTELTQVIRIPMHGSSLWTPSRTLRR